MTKRLGSFIPKYKNKFTVNIFSTKCNKNDNIIFFKNFLLVRFMLMHYIYIFLYFSTLFTAILIDSKIKINLMFYWISVSRVRLIER